MILMFGHIIVDVDESEAQADDMELEPFTRKESSHLWCQGYEAEVEHN